jgi:cation/acetate symporter
MLLAKIGDPDATAIIFFVLFIVVALGIAYWAARRTKTTEHYYAAGRSITGFQNGLALAGDYMSAASFLGIAGLVALFGFDGLIYSIGFLVGWPIVLFLIAEPLRNLGKYTFADAVAYRLRQRPVRLAAAFGTLAVVIFYLIAQMVGAGALIKLMFGIEYWQAVAIVGAVMMTLLLVGGMIATTWVQIVKACLLLGGAFVLAIWTLSKFNFNPLNLFDTAAAENGRKVLGPGDKIVTGSADAVSLGLALMFGTAGLPHILMRFYTVPNTKAARTSVNWATIFIGFFYLLTFVLGFGAMTLVGQGQIKAVEEGGNMAAPLLAQTVGGDVFLGFIAAVAFATILAVVAGLTITAAASFAHDIYASVVKKGKPAPGAEVKVARRTVVIIGIVAILGGIGANGQNVAFLVALAFAVAASANLPTIVYSLFWKRFTTQGALWSMYGGLASAIVLIIFSPVVSGSATSMLKTEDIDFAIFPLSNPGIVSIPLAFFLGWLGTVLDKNTEDPAKQSEMEVRSLTGVGAEKATQH